MTVSCPNCKRYTTVVTEADGHRWLYDIDPLDQGATDRRHVCGESDRSAY